MSGAFAAPTKIMRPSAVEIAHPNTRFDDDEIVWCELQDLTTVCGDHTVLVQARVRQLRHYAWRDRGHDRRSRRNVGCGDDDIDVV